MVFSDVYLFVLDFMSSQQYSVILWLELYSIVHFMYKRIFGDIFFTSCPIKLKLTSIIGRF